MVVLNSIGINVIGVLAIGIMLDGFMALSLFNGLLVELMRLSVHGGASGGGGIFGYFLVVLRWVYTLAVGN